MDFEIVKRQIIKAYRVYDDGTLPFDETDKRRWVWSLDEYFDIFRLYYSTYRLSLGKDHPRLKTETIAEVMRLLPSDGEMDFLPEDYPALIERYFEVDFDADYSIVHFTSGQIRMNRWYEVFY